LDFFYSGSTDIAADTAQRPAAFHDHRHASLQLAMFALAVSNRYAPDIVKPTRF